MYLYNITCFLELPIIFKVTTHSYYEKNEQLDSYY